MDYLYKMVGRFFGWYFIFCFYAAPKWIFQKLHWHEFGFVFRLAVYFGVASLTAFSETQGYQEYLIYSIKAFLILGGIGEFFALMIRRGEDRSDSHLRGNQIVSLAAVKKMTATEPHRFTIGDDIKFPIRLEGRHFLFMGATGTGKSRLFHQILQPSRDNSRALIVDIGGAMCSRYHRDGDVILNPRDARAAAWSPLAEIDDYDDIPLVTKAIIPDGEGSAAEWNGYAQRLMSGVLTRCWEQGGDNAEIIRLLSRASLEELRSLLAGLPAEGMLREGNERMMGSVMAIIASYVTPLSMLNPEAGAESFSISRWVAGDSAPNSWVYLNFRDNQIETLKPIIVAILGIASSAILSLPENPDRRLFVIIDEADALGQISNLDALTARGRKYGASVVMAVQTIAQIYKHYGRHGGDTMMANLSTQLIMRVSDPETANWASRIFGDEQLREEMTSTNSGTMAGEATTTTSYQIRTQAIVMPSEFMNLPDLVAMLNIVGDIPPCVTKIPPVNPPQICPEFVQRERRPRA